MILTRETNLEDIHVFPSFDNADSSEYEIFDIKTKYHPARKIVLRKSVFQCDDVSCAITFKGTAGMLKLENMQCPRCFQMTAGFIRNCDQDDEEEDGE